MEKNLKEMLGERYRDFFEKGKANTFCGKEIETLTKEDLIVVIGYLAQDNEIIRNRHSIWKYGTMFV